MCIRDRGRRHYEEVAKLLLLYNGPFLINKDNNNNTYALVSPNTKKIKGTYNITEMKKYHE